MNSPENISMFAAFSAGLLSFFSPCVLPLLPSYISFISGRSVNELNSMDGSEDGRRIRNETVLHSMAFVLGLSSIFILLGASATTIGGFLNTNREIIQQVGGIIIIGMGFHVMGLFKLNFLMGEKRLHLKHKPAGYFGSVLVGVAFATGWTPCIGPILGSILIYAATGNNIMFGMILLGIYSIGLGIPFVIASAGWSRFMVSTNRLKKHMRIISMASGLLLIVTGYLVFSDNMTIVSSFIDDLIG